MSGSSWVKDRILQTSTLLHRMSVPRAGASTSGPLRRRVVFERKMSLPDEACTCGTRTPAGHERIAMVHVPESIHRFVRSRTFCSAQCARAFLLEALSRVECEQSIEAEVASDSLRLAYEEVLAVMATLSAEANTNP